MNRAFSWKITITCAILSIGMIRASFWQWDRHIWKQGLIAELEERLRAPIVPLASLLSTPATNLAEDSFRRVSVSGRFDFDHEVILRNRRYEERAGGHVLTPMQVDGTDRWILVDRGFLPLGFERPENRKQFRGEASKTFYGLVKETMPRKFLAPSDGEPGLDRPWIDEWLRIDIETIGKQLPYPLVGFYLETMPDPNDPSIKDQIVKEAAGGRDEVLSLTGNKVENHGMDSPDLAYPIPVYDTTPPADIHLGYVYEWAFMALLTAGIGAISQMPRIRRRPDVTFGDTNPTD